MKKIGVFGIIFCLLIGAYSFMSYRQTLAQTSDTAQFLRDAFNATDGAVEGYSIHNWSVIDKEYRNIDQLKAMAQQLNRTFGIENAKESSGGEGDQNSVTLHGTWKNGADAQLVLKSMRMTDNAPQTALVLRIERETEDLQDYGQAIEKVRETALSLHAIPQISTCVKGFLPDRMEDGDSNSLVKRVFQKVKAKEIEGVRSGLVTSVSGFSPLSKDYIVTNGNKMNLQVAVHYDAYQGKTRILVGSPIVTIEY
ncbi:MAG: YwmB family TATA-box binding protein [Tumebacillaceae bacterium]